MLPIIQLAPIRTPLSLSTGLRNAARIDQVRNRHSRRISGSRCPSAGGVIAIVGRHRLYIYLYVYSYTFVYLHMYICISSMCTHTHRLVAGICAIVGRQRLGLLGQTPGFKGRALLEANHILCQLAIHAWVCTHTCVYACKHVYMSYVIMSSASSRYTPGYARTRVSMRAHTRTCRM